MKCWSVTIQMKATEQFFPVVAFIAVYKATGALRGYTPKEWPFK